MLPLTSRSPRSTPHSFSRLSSGPNGTETVSGRLVVALHDMHPVTEHGGGDGLRARTKGRGRTVARSRQRVLSINYRRCGGKFAFSYIIILNSRNESDPLLFLAVAPISLLNQLQQWTNSVNSICTSMVKHQQSHSMRVSRWLGCEKSAIDIWKSSHYRVPLYTWREFTAIHFLLPLLQILRVSNTEFYRINRI